jgi:RNA polymerase sigma-70 factor (ECF subfamily)
MAREMTIDQAADLGKRPLVEALRAGDERVFAELVARYSPAMLQLARMYVPSHALAEEVVQEAWLGVLRGLESFEGRSTLKTWIFRILTNCAKTRGERERRSVPFSALAGADPDSAPSVDPNRFLPADDPEYPRHWASVPRSFDELPEQALLGSEARALIEDTIAPLPDGQRAVITLRDLQGWGSDEVCELLAISEGNQRVLLHRARSRVRAALETYVESWEP